VAGAAGSAADSTAMVLLIAMLQLMQQTVPLKARLMM
jgi:hypothetical protein